ncbi:MAG TPA: N-acetylmuramoyl-L-alanine amidase [Verrucomicrobiae bacterium]|nr:N-acetylmuramoyl-L-alanine amidase [Verrucomicrobiae bacterium]
MFKTAGIIFCALVFLAGCSTTPPQSPLNWQDTNAVVKPIAIEINKPAVTIAKSNPPPAIISIPKPLPIAPVVTWASLGDWAVAHKTGALHLLSKTPVTTYAIGSSNGVMVLGIGTLGATWNGIEINLGFAPQMIDGEIFLNGLDLQKNLQPLLCEPPIAFPQTNRVIVIDPGHGGANLGTHSVLDGRFEKEFTLDWALRLKPLLETNGWTVFLTRTNDSYVTNADRVVFAEAHHADLFISLHFNAPGNNDAKANGLETYCITPTGMPSTLTRTFSDVWSEQLPNNSFDAQNLQLAVKLHSAILHGVGMEDRGVRRSRFDTVLRGQNRPAILIEGGYLSNPAEAKLIESADYRQKLAEAVANALK